MNVYQKINDDEIIDFSKKIRKNVFGFYAKNKKLCDEYYKIAEDTEIGNIYDFVYSNEEKMFLFSQVAIVVLTANKYENNMLHKNIYSLNGKNIKKFEIRLSTAQDVFSSAFAYCFEWNGYKVLHINANVTGSYTIGGSADVVRWVIENEYIYPMAIISLGICFGANENSNNLGDVIISKKMYPYFIGAKVKDKEIMVVDDNIFSLNSHLYNKINNLFTQNSFHDIDEQFGIRTSFGKYITGEAVVSSKKARDAFTSITTQEITAGDMEGYGLFKECRNNVFSIPCLTIKSICDWGVEKNFNENDEQVITEFKKIICDYCVENENELDEKMLKKLLKTLKDRIQAFAANSAFFALDIILKKEIFETSLYNLLQKWIYSYNGSTTSCKEFVKKANGILKQKGINMNVSSNFIHCCILLLHQNKQIKCNSECINNNKFVPCEKIVKKDSAIDVIKRGKL